MDRPLVSEEKVCLSDVRVSSCFLCKDVEKASGGGLVDCHAPVSDHFQSPSPNRRSRRRLTDGRAKGASDCPSASVTIRPQHCRARSSWHVFEIVIISPDTTIFGEDGKGDYERRSGERRKFITVVK